MADNTGPYVSKIQLLPEVVNAGLGSSKPITLSGLSGSTFGFAGVTGADLPVIGDWVATDTGAGVVTAVTSGPATLTVDVVAGIANGPATLYKPKPALTRGGLDSLVYLSMAFVDRSTRQWFNSRTFTATIEGTNSDLLQLSIPIIAVTKLVMNEEQTFEGAELADSFSIPVSRTYPDDRRNPRIKLRRDVRNVFLDIRRNSIFRRGRKQAITGSFGFLEEDGSTPAMIQRATLKYAMLKLLDPPGEAALDTVEQFDKGATKREKTDIHEIEYHAPVPLKGLYPLSGDREIDDLLLLYRGPMLLGGSFLDEGIESPRFYGGNG